MRAEQKYVLFVLLFSFLCRAVNLQQQASFEASSAARLRAAVQPPEPVNVPQLDLARYSAPRREPQREAKERERKAPEHDQPFHPYDQGVLEARFGVGVAEPPRRNRPRRNRAHVPQAEIEAGGQTWADANPNYIVSDRDRREDRKDGQAVLEPPLCIICHEPLAVGSTAKHLLGCRVVNGVCRCLFCRPCLVRQYTVLNAGLRVGQEPTLPTCPLRCDRPPQGGLFAPLRDNEVFDALYPDDAPMPQARAAN